MWHFITIKDKSQLPLKQIHSFFLFFCILIWRMDLVRRQNRADNIIQGLGNLGAFVAARAANQVVNQVSDALPGYIASGGRRLYSAAFGGDSRSVQPRTLRQSFPLAAKAADAGMPRRYGYRRSNPYGHLARSFRKRPMFRRRALRPIYGRRSRAMTKADITKGALTIIPRPQMGFAPRCMVKCSRILFVPGLVKTSGSGGSDFDGGSFHESLVVKGNSLSDSFGAHATGTMFGVSTYNDAYLQYRVHASKIDLWVWNTTIASSTVLTVTPIVAFIHPDRVDPVAGSNPATADSAFNWPNTIHGFVNSPGTHGYGAGAHLHLSMFRKTKRMFNETDIDTHAYAGATGVDPTNLFEWHVYMANVAGANSVTITYRCMVKLTYWVEFFHRKDTASTDF